MTESPSIRSTRPIPVLLGDNYEHVTASAEIIRTLDSVTIHITSKPGPDTQMLADLLEQVEPIALKIVAIPVRNTREKRENH